MPIGTSDGKTFANEWDYAANSLENYVPDRPAPIQPQTFEEALAVGGPKLLEQKITQPIQDVKNFMDTGTPEAAWNVATDLGGGGLAAADLKPGVAMFGGRMSKSAVNMAEKMESQNYAPGAVKLVTGLERGTDGMWRKEFSDADATYDPSKFIDTGDNIHVGQLSDVLNHPELYQSYPSAANIIVSKDANLTGAPTVKGKFFAPQDPNNSPVIALKPGMSPDEDKSVILHELQHFIQREEGFPVLTPSDIPGDIQYIVERNYMQSPEGLSLKSQVLDYLNSGKQKDAENFSYILRQHRNFQTYKNLSSEVEARNTQKRMNMTPNQRLNSPAFTTEDVDRANQLTRVPGTQRIQMGPVTTDTMPDLFD